MESVALYDEIARICRTGGASPSALRLLATLRQRAGHLVFRDTGRDAAGMPIYELGTAGALVRFTPPVRQIDSVRTLYLLAKHRGSYIPLTFGEPGKRRAEAVRKRLLKAVGLLAHGAPEVADELRRFEVRARNGGQTLHARLPWSADSPRLEVYSEAEKMKPAPETNSIEPS